MTTIPDLCVEPGTAEDVCTTLAAALTAAASRMPNPALFLADAGPAFAALLAKAVAQLSPPPASGWAPEAIRRELRQALEQSQADQG